MSRRALVCDDDRLSALWFERLLKEWGWSVQTTLSVDEAVAAFKESRPDVLISDLRIDDRSAQDLLAQLEIEPGPTGLPVIVVSATSPEELQSMEGLEGIRTLSKPVDPALLRAALSEIVEPSQSGVERQLSCLMLDKGGIGTKILGRMIEDFGAFVINAPDIETAKMLIRNVQPDAVILESDGSALDAEELSGFCTLNQLKLPPMVVLSPVINEGLVEQLLAAGAVDILLKPISSNRLKEAIRRIGGDAERNSAGQAEGRKNVLVVEDFMITSKTYERLLTQAGYQVRVVRSAEMAFEMIRRVRPDLLLLDMNLPGMSGYELLKTLKTSGQAVPTIVATGDHDPRKLSELQRLGILKHFDKPVKADELVSFVRSFFSDDNGNDSEKTDYDVLLALADDVSGGVLSEALKRHSIKCRVVCDGFRAVKEMNARPSVVVLDIGIGGLEGTEVLQRTRATVQSSHTRILAIADEMDDEISAELVEMGAHECLGKPYNLQQMTDKIRTLFTDSTPAISVHEIADEVLPEIERAFEQSDDDLFVAAARLGHNLKSTGALGDLPSVTKLAVALEEAAKGRHRDSCENILKEMRDDLSRAVTDASAAAMRP